MNVRHIFSNAAQLMFATVFVRVLSLASFPILTHLLTPEAYGVASLASTFISIFVIIGLSGQDASYVKCFYDKLNYQQCAVDHFYYRYAVFFGFIASILAMLAWLSYIYLQDLKASNWVTLFVGLGVLGSVLSTFSQARARLVGLYRRMMWALITSGILSTASCVYVAMMWQPNELALMTAVVSYWIIALIIPAGTVGLLFRKDSLTSTQKSNMIKIGLPLLATAPGYWVVSSSDRWFLAAYAGEYELGIYSVAVSVAMIGQMVTSTLVNVWYPAVSKQMQDPVSINYEKLALMQTLVIWLLLVTYFLISLFGVDLINSLASSKFQAAANYIPMLSLGLCFYGLNQFQGFGFTMMNKNHIIPLIWAGTMLVSLSMNFFLVPIYSADGAAFSQMLSYFILAIVTRYYSKKYLPFEPYWLRLICVLVYFMIVCFVFMNIRFSFGYWLVLMTKIVISLIAIFTSAWIVYPSGVLRIYSRAIVKIGG